MMYAQLHAISCCAPAIREFVRAMKGTKVISHNQRQIALISYGFWQLSAFLFIGNLIFLNSVNLFIYLFFLQLKDYMIGNHTN